jgi:predicted PurR-regulated permease PerM
MAKKINSIETLDQEITRLQSRAKDLEGELDNSLDYLQDNYSSMIMNSVFSKAASGISGGIKGGIISTILSFILGNEKLVEAFSRVTNHLVDKAADGIDRLADKIVNKKEDLAK